MRRYHESWATYHMNMIDSLRVEDSAAARAMFGYHEMKMLLHQMNADFLRDNLS